jgi:hypothetical protein
MKGRTLECNHWDLENMVRDLERQLVARALEQVNLAGDQEDAQEEL